MTLSIHIQSISANSRASTHIGAERSNTTTSLILVGDINLTIKNGQILALMGPSGSGKSSILAAVAGTLAESLHFEGEIFLHGQRVDQLPTAKRRIGLLFQDDLLFAHMTVLENLLFAVPAGDAKQRHFLALQALQEADLVGMGDRDPSTLSGGQRARVALMRALLAQPQALLLDEPFSKLDSQLRGRFKTFVFNHLRMRNIPALLVTHDKADAEDADIVVELAQSKQISL